MQLQKDIEQFVVTKKRGGAFDVFSETNTSNQLDMEEDKDLFLWLILQILKLEEKPYLDNVDRANMGFLDEKVFQELQRVPIGIPDPKNPA